MPTLGTAGTLAVDEDDLLAPPASFAGNSDVTGAGDDLADPSPTSVSALLGVNFGADGAGGVTAISYTGPALSSGTVPLAYAFDDATDTLTATAGAKTVFTLVVDEVAGTWTFTLLDHLDHPLVSTEDNLVLSFNATVTDADGDAVVQALSVNVDDDMPTLGTAGTLAVDEDDLLAPPASFAGNSDVTGAGDDLADPSPTSVSALLGVNFGADGAGGVTAISYTGPALSSGTVPLAYAFDDATDTLTATAGAKTVFTLVVDEVAGTWTFTLLDHLDHPLVSTEDNLVLSFNATVTDADGDAVVQALSVNVDDDMPVITDIQDAIVANTPGSVVGTIDMSYGADGGNQNSQSQVTVTTDAGDRTTNSGLVITGWDDFQTLSRPCPPTAKR